MERLIILEKNLLILSELQKKRMWAPGEDEETNTYEEGTSLEWRTPYCW